MSTFRGRAELAETHSMRRNTARPRWQSGNQHADCLIHRVLRLAEASYAVLLIAVHLAARILDTASAGEVVISRTVKDLVAGSGIAFDDAGEHFLKGIEERWQLFKVRTIA